MKWFWGLLILSLGILLLGQNLGYLNTFSGIKLLQFWPLILILFGISLIVKHFKYGWILILISFLLAFAFIYYMASNDKNLDHFYHRNLELIRKLH